MGKVFAAEPQYQHRPRVRVVCQRGQQLPRLRVILSGLAAAKGMCKSIQSFHRCSLQKILIIPCQLVGYIIHAAHGRNDPHFITDGRFSVFPQKAGKCLCFLPFYLTGNRPVCVSHLTGKICFHIMGMDPLPGCNIRFRMTDRISVLYHLIARCNMTDGHLMPLGHVLQRLDMFCSNRNDFPFCNRVKRHRDIVSRCNFQY